MGVVLDLAVAIASENEDFGGAYGHSEALESRLEIFGQLYELPRVVLTPVEFLHAAQVRAVLAAAGDDVDDAVVIYSAVVRPLNVQTWHRVASPLVCLEVVRIYCGQPLGLVRRIGASDHDNSSAYVHDKGGTETRLARLAQPP